MNECAAAKIRLSKLPEQLVSFLLQMDAFRLLTRSIKLKATSQPGVRSPNILPSAGEANTPQLFPVKRTFLEDDGTRGTKRKRASGEESLHLSDDEVPNFFGSEPTASSTAATSIKLERKKKRVVEETVLEEQALSESIFMTEDERKLILKTHKIKITDLRVPPVVAVKEDTGGKKSKRKKQKAEAPPVTLTKKQKKAAQRLYPEPLTSFGKLRTKYRISRRLSENIASQGYTVPTEVQLGSLPLLLGSATSAEGNGAKAGSSESQLVQAPDLLVVAPTGSGKTLAFIIPLINKILKHHHMQPEANDIFAIVLAPTKELVAQIVNEGRKLTAGTGVRVTAMRKGMRIVEERGRDEEVAEGTDNEVSESSDDDKEDQPARKQRSNEVPLTKSAILVSTPLILAHALSDGKKKDICPMPYVQTLVLDEADVLLDPLFREQTLDVWKACTNPQLRVSLWSATMGSNIEELSKSTISNRREVLGINEEHPLFRLVVGLKDTAIPNITHKLIYAATEQGKLLGLRQLLHPSAAGGSTVRLRPPFLVFTQTIARAVALHSELMYDIPPEAGGFARIAVLHSELSDSKRSDVMAGFRKGDIWILITTDLLARGVDFRGINGVVNYDIPNTSAAYIHRVGRTGRAGREGGMAVTFYTKDDIPYVKNIANVISASEKLRGTEEGERIPKWLLNALPSLSKNDKKDLKKYGVKARRPSALDGDAKAAKKTRISTKSGFDRRIENKRKGAVQGSQNRKMREKSNDADDDDAWNGIED